MAEKQDKEKCIFCDIAKGKIPSEKIYEDDKFFAIKDINPKIKGHTIVICKQHYKNLIDMPSSLYGEFLEAAEKVALELIKEQNAQGFNLHMNNFKCAGQLVEHVHIHVLPRYEKDNFKACA
jgi:histidine triad (HIT) family protein